jgi:hypothetical protein
MLVAGLGTPEIIVLVIVFLIIVVPPVAIILLVVFLVKRNRNSNARLKKCAFCGYSIPVEATVCQFCSR